MAPTVPVVEAAAASAALPSPHTDNMAAAEEETHGSATSRRIRARLQPRHRKRKPPSYRRRGEVTSVSAPIRIKLSAAMVG